MSKVVDQTIIFDWDDIDRRLSDLLWKLKPLKGESVTYIYGVPHGGYVVAGLFQLKSQGVVRSVPTPEKARFIVDDVIDTGRTRDAFCRCYPHQEFVALMDKKDEGTRNFWIHFPWEREDEPVGVRQSTGKVIGTLKPRKGH